MTEQEYIAATNLTKIRAAAAVLRDIIPGFDGVVTDETIGPIRSGLAELQERLNKKVSAMCGDEE